MFGTRFLNKIANGNGNIQVSGNIEKVEIGINFKEHLRAVEKRANEIREEQLELRNSREIMLRTEADIANKKIDSQQIEIDKLNEIIRDPQKYLDYAEIAEISLSSFLHDLEEKRISGNLQEIRKDIKAGSFANAERLLEDIEKLPSLNSKLKAETVSARATLAFLDLRFEKAEALSRRAFYLEPNINTLIALLDQMDMNGNRGKLLATLGEAKASLPNDLDPYTAVRLLAVEATTYATTGELTRAKFVIKSGESAIRKLPTADPIAAIQLTACRASMAIVEEDQLKALKYFKSTLKMLKENEYGDDLFTTRIEANVGACLAELGRLPEAVNVTKDCVERLRKIGDTGRYHLGIRLNNLGDFLTRSGRAEEALDILRESIELAEGNLPAKHPSLIRRRLNLALALKKLGHTKSAIIELQLIQVDEENLDELDRRSLVKANNALFDYCVHMENWVDALSAALYIQKIGTEYLGNQAVAEALPNAILAIRNSIISGNFNSLNTRKKITGPTMR